MERAGDPATAEALCQLVLAKGYLRREQPFRLSSGGSSRDYVDLRRALAGGEDLALGARVLLERLAALGVAFDAVGGMTMGADPIAHAVALLAPCAWFSVRKQEKEHGAGRRIEGAEIGPGARVVLVEDTVSTGRSMLQALEVVRGAGAEVVLACALLDRGDEAAERFAAAEVAYDALLNYRDLGIEAIPGAASSA